MKSRNENKQLCSFRFTRKLKARLARESKRTGLTETKILERALGDYLNIKH